MKKLFAILLAVFGTGSAAVAETPKVPPAEMSGDLRTMVFNLSASDDGITPDNYPHEVWGVVMETGMDSGFYTLVALADGTTSLYFSSGGGIIGAGQHPGVREASTAFIGAANRDVAQAQPSTGHAPPTQGETVFYFLTFNGLQAYRAHEQDLGNGNDKLSGLFHAAQAIITAIRNVQSQ